jgi:hypothetical protein
LNTLEMIRPRHANKIKDESKLNSLFYQKEKTEVVKLNMMKEFEKHKEIMDILPIFESHSYLKTLEFYQQFGIENIYSTAPKTPEENQANSPGTQTNHIINEAQSESEHSENSPQYQYQFCNATIPMNLSKEEYTIHSSIESLLKDAMVHKNKSLLSHEKVIHSCKDISIVIRQLIHYFLNT